MHTAPDLKPPVKRYSKFRIRSLEKDIMVSCAANIYTVHAPNAYELIFGMVYTTMTKLISSFPFLNKLIIFCICIIVTLILFNINI